MGSESIAITDMKVRAVNNVTNVSINITRIDSRPRDVVSDAPGVVNQYINIDKSNVADADIGKVTMDFKVDKLWIKENNINESTISLYRYGINDQWTRLETVKTSEDNINIYFQAVSPGLSVFAVVGESKEGAKAPSPISQEKIKEVLVKKGYWKNIVIMLIIVITATIAIYLLKKRSTSAIKTSKFIRKFKQESYFQDFNIRLY